MVRKAGKLPLTAVSAPYTKEYEEEHGCDRLCVQTDLLHVGNFRVLLVDDLVATGGTMKAAVDLLQSVGAKVVACACLVHLHTLGAQARVPDVPIQPLYRAHHLSNMRIASASQESVLNKPEEAFGVSDDDVHRISRLRVFRGSAAATKNG